MDPSTKATTALASGARSIADLAPAAGRAYGDHTAMRSKREGAWVEQPYAEMARAVQEIAIGLIDLGVERGDRVCLLADTGPAWTWCDFAIASAGAIVVPIYPTNSPEECEWVIDNSGAKVVVCDDATQVAKVERVRRAIPSLESVIAIEPSGVGGDAIPLDQLRARGEGADTGELDARRNAVSADDAYTFVYTSGTTGPPKGCVLSHGNFRSALAAIAGVRTVRAGDTIYLYLPLAHVFARVVQLAAIDLGAEIVYAADTKRIVDELGEVKPTYLPSVPRIFEKLYGVATAGVPEDERESLAKAIELGIKLRELEARGEPVPKQLRAPFEEADERYFAKVRALFGGRLREATTGAAPIAPEMLELFFACGVPVLEGFGMTETTAVGTLSTVERHHFGTVGRPLPGVEVMIADDGEILMRGWNVFTGYWRNEEATREAVDADGWLHTGDVGELNEEGYLRITGRKKDLIITAGGKNIAPANLENDLKQSRWISQAIAYGDRRPYLVALITLDPDEIGQWARERGLPEDLPSLADHADVLRLIQGVLDEVNSRYAKVEQIKKFAILDRDLAQETGELTPTLKVKRGVVNERFDDVFAALY